MLLRVPAASSRQAAAGEYTAVHPRAEAGGIAAVCATEEYQQRIQANAKNKATLMAMDCKDYIAKMNAGSELSKPAPTIR